jgi:type I restriction enzyme, R subunit
LRRDSLEALLDKFADGGVNSLEWLDILKVDPLTKFGTPIEIIKLFGGKDHYLAAIQELEAQLYQEVA